MLASTALNLGSLGGSLLGPLTRCSSISHKPLLLHASQSLPLLGSRQHLLKVNPTTSNWGNTIAVSRAVATVDSPDPLEKQQDETKKYYYVVANAKFMLDEEEHFKELLFERLRLYGERNKEQDFWLVVEPKFLDNFPNITRRLKRPAVALVSTDGTWITFMKLRLDRVLQESYEADSLEEALASNPVNLQFDEPEKWVAPYPKYEYGWWGPFLPPGSEKPKI